MALSLLICLLASILTVNSWVIWYGGLTMTEKETKKDHFVQTLTDPTGQVEIFKRTIMKSKDFHHITPWMVSNIMKIPKQLAAFPYIHMDGAFFAQTDSSTGNLIKFVQVVFDNQKKKITPYIFDKATKIGRDYAHEWADIDNFNLYMVNNGEPFFVNQKGISGLCPMIAINHLFQGPLYNEDELEKMSVDLGNKVSFWSSSFLEYAAKKTTGGAWGDDVIHKALGMYNFEPGKIGFGTTLGFNKKDLKNDIIKQLNGIVPGYREPILGVLISTSGHIFALKEVKGLWYNLDGLPEGFSAKHIAGSIFSFGSTFDTLPNPFKDKKGMKWGELVNSLTKSPHLPEFEYAEIIVRKPALTYKVQDGFGIDIWKFVIIIAVFIIFGCCVCWLLLGFITGSVVANYTKSNGQIIKTEYPEDKMKI